MWMKFKQFLFCKTKHNIGYYGLLSPIYYECINCGANDVDGSLKLTPEDYEKLRKVNWIL